MDSLFILIPIAVVFVAVAIRAFIWAVNNRQYEDLDTAAQRILFDDDVEVTVRSTPPQQSDDHAAATGETADADKRDGDDQ